MHTRSFFLALLVAPLLASAQNIIDNRTANVLPLWKKGQRMAYTVTDTKKTYEGNLLKETKSSSFKLTYTVLDTTGGFRMEQRMSDLKVLQNAYPEGLTKEAKAMLDRTMGMYTAVPVIYTCDRDGNVQELANPDQLVSGVQKFMNEAANMMPDDSSRMLMSSLLGALVTPETITSSALEHPNALHFLYGGGYTVAERIEQDIELPNLLGGDPVPGKLTLVMNTMDARTAKATFTVTLRMDSEKMQAMVRDFINKMAQAAGQKLDAQMERELGDAFRSMRMTETYNMNVDLNGATVTKLVYKREVSASGEREVNEQTFQLVP